MIEKELQLLDKMSNEKQAKIDSLFLQLDQATRNFNQMKQSKPRQEYGSIISKVILLNIIYNLDAKQIIEMRLVNRQFNNLIIEDLPFILDSLKNKLQIIETHFPYSYIQQHQDLLKEVNFNNIEKNLEQIEKKNPEDINPENQLCIHLMFELVTMNMPEWDKALGLFYLKIQALKRQMYKNKQYLNYFNLNDKQVELIKKRIITEFRELRYDEELYDDLNLYVQNLMQLAQLPNYKDLRTHFQKHQVYNNLERQYKIIKNISISNAKEQQNNI